MKRQKEMVIEGLDSSRSVQTAAQAKEAAPVGASYRTSKIWDEEEMQLLMDLPGVYVCHVDMCAYGLRVKDGLKRSQPLSSQIHGA